MRYNIDGWHYSVTHTCIQIGLLAKPLVKVDVISPFIVDCDHRVRSPSNTPFNRFSMAEERDTENELGIKSLMKE